MPRSSKMVENATNQTLPDNGSMSTMNCGELTEADFDTINACSFWVEGIAMTVCGIFALITNAISIYVFSR